MAQVFPTSLSQGKHCIWAVICLANLTFSAVITPSRQLNEGDISSDLQLPAAVTIPRERRSREGRQHRDPQVRGAWICQPGAPPKSASSRQSRVLGRTAGTNPKCCISLPGKRPLQLVFPQLGEFRMCFLTETSCKAKACEDTTEYGHGRMVHAG